MTKNKSPLVDVKKCNFNFVKPEDPPSSYPYIELKCSFCPNPIFVPGDGYVSCSKCKSYICIGCAPDIQKMYGNKYYSACSMLANECYRCDSDYESESESEYESDDDNEML